MSNQGELAAVAAVGGMEAVDGYTVIGQVLAVEAAVPRAPPPPPALYRSYEYYMDGRHMGRLHLDPVQKKCSWKSNLTGEGNTVARRTSQVSQQQLGMFFDYEGRENSGKYTVIFPGGQGKDYRGRTIRIGQIDLWQCTNGNYQYVGRG